MIIKWSDNIKVVCSVKTDFTGPAKRATLPVSVTFDAGDLKDLLLMDPINLYGVIKKLKNIIGE